MTPPVRRPAEERPRRTKRINVRLLRKVQKHILEEPKRFQMGTWIERQTTPEQKVYESANSTYLWRTHRFAKCGTAACIAGWAVLLEAKRPEAVGAEDIERRAGKLLHIPSDEEMRLFGVVSWPQPYRRRYLVAKTPATRARIAAARIDHFIRTNGAE